MKILQSIMETIKPRLESETSEQRPDADLVRQRAYELWEQSGKPDSDGVEFWLLAEKELA